MKATTASAVLIGSLSLWFSGCGSGDETSSYRLVPVTGTVTLNNKPLGGAKIDFLPDASNQPMTPGGDTTGPEGNYRAMYRNRSGLAPGKYKVVVTSMPPGLKIPDQFKDDPMMYQHSLENVTKGAAKKELQPITDERSVEVPEKGGIIDIDVKASSSASPAAEAKK